MRRNKSFSGLTKAQIRNLKSEVEKSSLPSLAKLVQAEMQLCHSNKDSNRLHVNSCKSSFTAAPLSDGIFLRKDTCWRKMGGFAHFVGRAYGILYDEGRLNMPVPSLIKIKFDL